MSCRISKKQPWLSTETVAIRATSSVFPFDLLRGSKYFFTIVWRPYLFYSDSVCLFMYVHTNMYKQIHVCKDAFQYNVSICIFITIYTYIICRVRCVLCIYIYLMYLLYIKASPTCQNYMDNHHVGWRVNSCLHPCHQESFESYGTERKFMLTSMSCPGVWGVNDADQWHDANMFNQMPEAKNTWNSTRWEHWLFQEVVPR